MDGYSALLIAIGRNHYRVAELLLEEGADIATTDKVSHPWHRCRGRSLSLAYSIPGPVHGSDAFDERGSGSADDSSWAYL